MKLFDIIKESVLELDEQAALRRLFQGFLKDVKVLTIKELRAAHPVFAKDLQKVFAARTIDGVSKIDDLVVGIGKGTLSARAYGDLIVGLLKTKGVSDDYIKLVAKSWVEDARFIKNYTTGGDKLTAATLSKKGYSETAVKEILAASKNSTKLQKSLKAYKDGLKTVPKPPNSVGGGLKAATEGLWNNTIGRLFKGGKNAPKVKPNQKQIVDVGSKWLKRAVTARKVVFIGSLLALGYVGYVIFKSLQDVLGEDALPDLDDVDVPDNVKDWKKCIVDALDGENVTTSVENEDEFYVMLMVDKFAGKDTGGWIRFYNNYKVTTKSGETGKWDCDTDVKKGLNEQEDSQLEMDQDVEQMIDLLDFPVSGSDLQSAHALLKKYLNNGKGQSFLSLYQRSGLGSGDLRKTLKYIVTTKATSTRLKDEMLSMISKIENGSTKKDTEGTKSDKEQSGDGKTSTSHINVTWDDKSSGGESGGGKIKYSPCDSFPMTLGCISDKIKDIQRCLNPTANLKVDGYFGPLTLDAMQDKSKFAGFKGDGKTITKEVYDSIMDKCENKESKSGDKETVKPTDTGVRPKVEPLDLEPLPIKKLDSALMQDKFGETALLNLMNKTVNDQRIKDVLISKLKFRGGRYILKQDEELTLEQLKVINQWMSGLGYELDKKRETLDKSKYVWSADLRSSRVRAREINKTLNIR